MTISAVGRAGALLVVARAIAAQQPPPRPLWLVAKSDTVLVYLTVTPASGGFVVYRSLSPGVRQKRTAEPVVRVRDPAVAAGMLGPDFPMVMRALRATDEGELFRRLNNDRFAAAVLSGLSRSVAQVLGRLYVDTGAVRGSDYEYRVVFTDRAGAETDRAVTGRVLVTDIRPPPPVLLKVSVGDQEARLSWSYPPYRGDPGDLVLGFEVYRADGAVTPIRRLTATPLIRN